MASEDSTEGVLLKRTLLNLEVRTTQDDVDNCSNRPGTSAWTEIGSVCSEECEQKMKEAVARMDTADKALKVEEEIIRKLEIILMKKVNKQKAVDDEDYEQAILLKDLLSLRNRMRVGRSNCALTNLFKHPVIVTFTLEKWRHIRLFFFLHLR